MNSKFKFLLFPVLLLFFNCTSTKTLRFTKKADDIVKTESLKNFLKENKNPKVVLRVKDNSYTAKVTEDEDINYLFNAIENELLTQGFIVRDRQLFNQIVENEDNNIDYEVLKSKSDTDLIIELTKLDPEVEYTTNTYYNKNNDPRVEKDYTFKKVGASVEFKVVLISTNEFAGIYKFNYTPCLEGCVISKSIGELTKERKRRAKEKEVSYQGVEKDELELFIKRATKQLVTEMRL